VASKKARKNIVPAVEVYRKLVEEFLKTNPGGNVTAADDAIFAGQLLDMKYKKDEVELAIEKGGSRAKVYAKVRVYQAMKLRANRK